MFNKEQQQAFNQSYEAYLILTDFISEGAPKDKRKQLEADLQLQGILARLGGVEQEPLNDNETMFIRALVTGTPQLKMFTGGYSRFFLEMTPDTFAGVAGMKEKTQQPPLSLRYAVQCEKSGQTGSIRKAADALMLIFSSFLSLSPEQPGRTERLQGYVSALQRYIEKEGFEWQMNAADADAEQTQLSYDVHPADNADGLQELERSLKETLSSLAAGAGDPEEPLRTGGRTSQTISSLVEDLFGGGAVTGQGTQGAQGARTADRSASQNEQGQNQNMQTGTADTVRAAGGEGQDPQPQEADRTNAMDYAGEDVDARIEEILQELNALTGLTGVKEEVRSLINIQKVNVLRRNMGLKEADVSKHLVFAGNPGTGKTTVARILAKVYHELGILKEGQLVETDRAGLVAGYIGQTAIKTSEMIQKAMGGVLFIDEAYTLSSGREGDYGQEAIDTILKAMEDHRDAFVVICAGYTQLMEEFMDSNPGLRSRFSKVIEFPDYTAEELTTIFGSMCGKNGYRITEEGEAWLQAHYEEKLQEHAENFANARDVRNLFEAALSRQANRLAGAAGVTKEQLETLLPEDLGQEKEVKTEE